MTIFVLFLFFVCCLLFVPPTLTSVCLWWRELNSFLSSSSRSSNLPTVTDMTQLKLREIIWRIFTAETFQISCIWNVCHAQWDNPFNPLWLCQVQPHRELLQQSFGNVQLRQLKQLNTVLWSRVCVCTLTEYRTQGNMSNESFHS